MGIASTLAIIKRMNTLDSAITRSLFRNKRSLNARYSRKCSTGLTASHVVIASKTNSFLRRVTPSTSVIVGSNVLLCRSFSAAPETSSRRALSLRNIVKPFLLKCHPDVQRSDFAREINLKAIQNLNGFLDTMQTISSGKFTRQKDNQIVKIDFVLQFEGEDSAPLGLKKKKKAATASHSSRRKVELELPPTHLLDAATSNDRSRSIVERHAMQQIVKLLKIAGLSIPTTIRDNETEQAQALRDAWEQNLGIHDEDGNESPPNADHRRPHFDYRRPPSTHYERSRERFAANINWKRYDQLYQEAMVDMHADLATEGLIRDNRKLRSKMVATVLANVRVQDETIGVLEQLTAARRLSLLLEANFDDLHFEDFGNMWETMVLVLTPSRDFNASASARYRRRGRNEENGFSFTLHPDYSVTIHVPIDFQDDELVQELDRNLWDFYNLIGDGLEGLYPEY